MSSVAPSCSRPLHPYSHHESSFGDYSNRGIHVQLSNGTVNLSQREKSNDNFAPFPSKPLDKLQEHCSPKATFDSGERFDPPRCAEATRIEIIQRMERWINEDGSNTAPVASLFWLYGGAGVGKSALAHTLAQRFHQKQKLAASFFFFRNDALRSDGNTLIPTLVLQLVNTFKGLGPFVEKGIHSNTDLFTKQHQTQIQELLVEPLLRLKSRKVLALLPIRSLPFKGARLRPRLIVIDGLDECRSLEDQCSLLRAIANAIALIPYPLRFLVTSRPEQQIVRAFNHDRALQAVTVDRYNLSDDPNADTDIRKFLKSEFNEIRRSHSVSPYLPPDWPPKNSINLLVERSSGHFIYAATVIRYIRSEQHRPDDRLNVVLRLLPPREQDQPYAQLDALYSLIFQGVESQDKLQKIYLVFGILYVHNYCGLFKQVSYADCRTIERILGMKAGDVVLVLSAILSLVTISNEEVRILHKSLFDYLLDRSRCGHLRVPFDLARVHELVATFIVKEKLLANCCTIFEFANFAYHCRFGYLNDSLKNYLRDLEVPYPRCVETTLDNPLKMNRLNNSLRMIMSHFFRVLSRDDFDATGHYHKEYAGKWMSYLQSAVPGCDQPQTRTLFGSADPLGTDTHDVKNTLDAILKEWKPRNFKPPEVGGVIPIRYFGAIEREHRVWSAFVRASTSVKSNGVSSLVFGDDFIHSYHFTTEESTDNSHFLTLLTYSTYENASDDNDFLGYKDIVEAMRNCLERAENFLLSDFSRQYGVFPEGML